MYNATRQQRQLAKLRSAAEKSRASVRDNHRESTTERKESTRRRSSPVRDSYKGKKNSDAKKRELKGSSFTAWISGAKKEVEATDNVKSVMSDESEDDVIKQVAIMEQMASVVKQFNQDKKDMETERDKLESELNSKTQECETLRHSFASVSVQFAQKADEEQKMEERKLMNAIEEKHKKDIALLDKEISRLEKENERLLESKKQTAQYMEEENQKFNEIISFLTEDIAEVKSEAAKEMAKMQTAIDEKDMELQRVMSTVGGSMTALEDSEAEVTKLIEQNAELEERLVALEERVVTLTSENEELQTETNDLEEVNRVFAASELEAAAALEDERQSWKDVVAFLKKDNEVKEQKLTQFGFSETRVTEKRAAQTEAMTAIDTLLHDADGLTESVKNRSLIHPQELPSVQEVNDCDSHLLALEQRNNDLETAMANMQRKTQSKMQNLKRACDNDVALQEREMAQQERERLRAIDDLKRKTERLSQYERLSQVEKQSHLNNSIESIGCPSLPSTNQNVSEASQKIPSFECNTQCIATQLQSIPMPMWSVIQNAPEIQKQPGTVCSDDSVMPLPSMSCDITKLMRFDTKYDGGDQFTKPYHIPSQSPLERYEIENKELRTEVGDLKMQLQMMNIETCFSYQDTKCVEMDGGKDSKTGQTMMAADHSENSCLCHFSTRNDIQCNVHGLNPTICTDKNRLGLMDYRQVKGSEKGTAWSLQ